MDRVGIPYRRRGGCGPSKHSLPQLDAIQTIVNHLLLESSSSSKPYSILTCGWKVGPLPLMSCDIRDYVLGPQPFTAQPCSVLKEGRGTLVTFPCYLFGVLDKLINSPVVHETNCSLGVSIYLHHPHSMKLASDLNAIASLNNQIRTQGTKGARGWKN